MFGVASYLMCVHESDYIVECFVRIRVFIIERFERYFVIGLVRYVIGSLCLNVNHLTQCLHMCHFYLQRNICVCVLDVQGFGIAPFLFFFWVIMNEASSSDKQISFERKQQLCFAKERLRYIISLRNVFLRPESWIDKKLSLKYKQVKKFNKFTTPRKSHFSKDGSTTKDL